MFHNGTAQCQESPFWSWCLAWRKMKAHEWVPSFSSCVRWSQRPLSLAPSRVLSHELQDWGAVSRWEKSSQGLEVIKRMLILTNSNWIKFISRPAHCQNFSPVDPHDWPIDTSSILLVTPMHLPLPCALCAFQWQWERELCQMANENTQETRKLAQIYWPRTDCKIDHLALSLKKSKRERALGLIT